MNNAPDRIWAASATENYGEWQTTTDGLPRPTAYIRADLYTALEAQLAARTCTVNALEWIERPDGGGTFHAETCVGNYIAKITEGDGFWSIYGITRGGYCDPDIEAVKAAAQADYERRILSALEPAAPEGQQPAAWPKERVNIPDPHNAGARIVGFRIRQGDEAFGESGLSEPLFWLNRALTRPAEQAVTEADLEYEVWTTGEDSQLCAMSTSLSDAMHYAKVYGQDGPVEIFKVIRFPLKAAIEAGRHE